MTAVSEGEIYSQYAQSNTGKQCTDQACITNFIKILDNPAILLSTDEDYGKSRGMGGWRKLLAPSP
jgi:ArsR family metal-binding transcriptional regulator